MITLYNDFFRFPLLDYQLSAGVAVAAVLASLAVAALGGLTAVRRAVRIPPAEAMRPEAPARYRESVIERFGRRRKRIGRGMAARMILRNLERQPVRSLSSITGIALAVAVLFVGLSFVDIMDRFMSDQFELAMRQDATVSFVEPRSGRAIHEVERLPGALEVEASRNVAVRLRSGSRQRTLAITGVPPDSRLTRIVDRGGRELPVPPAGIVLSRILGDILEVAPGDLLRVEVLEGARPTSDVPVAALVNDSLGLQAYMHIETLRALMREGATVTGAALTLDSDQLLRFYAKVKGVPVIAGVSFRDRALQNFRDTMAANMNIQIFFFVVFACIIAFGVVYNSARVSLSERSRELASLRVLGFTRAEISLILLGELALLTLVGLPIGAVIGYLLGQGMMYGFNNEVYRLSFVISSATIAWSFLIVIAAAAVSGLVVRRRLDRLDLVAVLKTRE
jgi:putative ABC transport system permease protein